MSVESPNGATRNPVSLAPLRGVEPICDERLEELLHVHDWSSESAFEVRQWFRVAFTHYAQRYSSGEEYPGVTHETLALLRNVGSIYLGLNVLRNVVNDAPQSNLTYRHEKHTQLVPKVRAAISENPLVKNLALVFEPQLANEEMQIERRAAESRRRPGSLMLESIALQFLGLLAIYRLQETLDRLLADAYNRAKINSGGALNYGDIFEVYVVRTYKGHDGLRLETEREGPDHGATFIGRAITRDGNIGTGRGTSKRDALRVAKLDYLSKYRPDLLREPEQGRIVMPPDDDDLPGGFVVAASSVAKLFGADRDSRYFRQALVHSSWAHENLRKDLRKGKDTDHSNIVLTNLGSFVINELVSRISGTAWLRLTSKPDPRFLDMVSASSRSISSLFKSLGLEDKLLLGRGMPEAINAKLATSTVQAVFGAAYISHNFNCFKVEESLPPPARKWLADIIASGSTEQHFTARRHMLFLNLSYDESMTRSGPDHDTFFECSASVRSPVLEEEVSLHGSGSSKRDARNRAIIPFSKALSYFTDDFEEEPPYMGAGQSSDQVRLLSFILRHQIVSIPEEDVSRLKWIQSGYLGAAMLARGDTEKFRRWSDFAIQYLPQFHKDSKLTSRLRLYYEQSADQRVKRSDTFANVLEEVLAWVRQCARDNPGRYRETPMWEQLLALCAAQKARMTDQDPRPLRSVLDDWLILQRRRFRSEMKTDFEHEAIIEGSIAAGITYCLADLAEHFPQSGIRIESKRPTESFAEIIVSGDQDWVPLEAIPTMISLVCDVVSGISCTRFPKRVELHVECVTQSQVNVLNQLANSGPSNELDGEVARILHDLKNELYAAQVAASQPVLDIRRSQGHLAEASRLSRRLTEVRSLYVTTRMVPISLDGFFYSYVTGARSILPVRMLLAPPEVPNLTVLGNVPLLRSAIDNLVNNAIEAMPDGGLITFSYNANRSEGFVSLEISDTGPGIPYDILDAIARGRSSYSSKAQGSGLGLLCARQFVRRMGGILSPGSRERGHTWIIELPLATAGVGATGVESPDITQINN